MTEPDTTAQVRVGQEWRHGAGRVRVDRVEHPPGVVSLVHAIGLNRPNIYEHIDTFLLNYTLVKEAPE